MKKFEFPNIQLRPGLYAFSVRNSIEDNNTNRKFYFPTSNDNRYSDGILWYNFGYYMYFTPVIDGYFKIY